MIEQGVLSEPQSDKMPLPNYSPKFYRSSEQGEQVKHDLVHPFQISLETVRQKEPQTLCVDSLHPMNIELEKYRLGLAFQENNKELDFQFQMRKWN